MTVLIKAWPKEVGVRRMAKYYWHWQIIKCGTLKEKFRGWVQYLWFKVVPLKFLFLPFNKCTQPATH